MTKHETFIAAISPRDRAPLTPRIGAVSDCGGRRPVMCRVVLVGDVPGGTGGRRSTPRSGPRIKPITLPRTGAPT